MELTRTELFESIWAEPMGAVAARYGLTGNGLAKICDRLDIPRPPRSHWTRTAAARDPRPELPPAPIGLSETFALGRRQTRQSPGTRTRMSAEERREHLMDTAARIALEEGVSAVTIREVARIAGISETQVHNCFGGRTELLLALARREIAGQESQRRRRIARGTNHQTRVMLSTIGYLHEAARRGPLLQMLFRTPEVRDALKPERIAQSDAARAPILQQLVGEGKMDLQSARASTAALTSVALKAGGIVAGRRAPFAMVEEICLTVVMAGTFSGDALTAGAD
ncbi:TetR family transcriptional regulator [Qipengyuania sp. JC766]|uniref:TetR/AcrR family transcriptional regulator n=1 Tax=Qipengyuania sp. JC766 TaxID=3232139 RepID=UPI00345B14EE